MSERENKKRPVRPSALKAQQTFLQSANGEEQVSSDDDGGGFEKRPQRRNATHPKVDLYKMDATSLQRYRKVYKLGDAPAATAKEDLMPAVARHFAAQVMDEEDVLVKFIQAIQRHSGKQSQRHPGGTPQSPHHPSGAPIPLAVRKVAKPNVATLPQNRARAR